MSKLMAGIIAALLAVAMPGLAHAITANLTLDHCTGGCSDGTLPFGTVTINQVGSDLSFSVQLNGSYVFQKSTAFDAFGFNLPGTPTVTSLTSGFSYDSGGYQGDGFGNFLQGIKASATGGQSLSFLVLNATLAGLGDSTNPPGDTSVMFAVDLSSPNGNTGNVGGSADPAGVSPTPIPGTAMLLGSALAGVYALRQRRKRLLSA